MQRRIWLVLAFIILILIGLHFFPMGIRNLGWFLRGKTPKGNYPGAAFANPAWFLLLPFSILTIWKRKLGGRLSGVAGAAGTFGTLTMPCAWERINRSGLLGGIILSAIAGLLGFWLSRKPRLDVSSEEIIR
jgi:hypothetical protein